MSPKLIIDLVGIRLRKYGDSGFLVVRHRCVAALLGFCVSSFEGFFSKRQETLIQQHSVTLQKT